MSRILATGLENYTGSHSPAFLPVRLCKIRWAFKYKAAAISASLVLWTAIRRPFVSLSVNKVEEWRQRVLSPSKVALLICSLASCHILWAYRNFYHHQRGHIWYFWGCKFSDHAAMDAKGLFTRTDI